MKSIEVLGARFNEQYQVIEVIKEITNDDNSTELNLHTIPLDTFEWRAAIYGMDDIDSILEVILYEPFVELSNPFGKDRQSAKNEFVDKVAAAKTRLKKNTKVPAIKTMNKLSLYGVDEVYVEAANGNLNDLVRDHCHFDEEAIEIKKTYVDEKRAAFVENIQPSRVQELKRSLFPHKDTTRPTQATKQEVTEPPPIIMHKRKRVEG